MPPWLEPLASPFDYRGLPRLSYFWSNPNHAAAVLVGLLPWFWQLTVPSASETRSSFVRAALLLGEVLLSAMITLTYSRAAAMAWMAALLIFAVCIRRAAPADRRLPFRLAARFGFFLAVLGTSGLFGRIQTVADGDASATNRLELWRGGLELIAARPVTGWGQGNSGWAYMQWLQRPDVEVPVGGMNNTFLHLGVEFGLVVLGLVVVPILFAFILNQLLFVRQPAPGRAAVAPVIVALVVCNGFSTLWREPAVVVLMAGAIAVPLLAAFKHRQFRLLRVALSLSAGAAVLACTAVYGLSRVARHQSQWQIEHKPDRSVALTAKNFVPHGVTVTLLPDDRVLGRIYGRAIRDAAAPFAGAIGKLVFYPPGVRPAAPLAGVVLVFGPRVDEAVSFGAVSALYYVCPSRPPPEEAPAPVLPTVIIPELDQFGTAGLWRKWAARHQAKLHSVRGVGQNISVEWSRLFGDVVRAPLS